MPNLGVEKCERTESGGTLLVASPFTATDKNTSSYQHLEYKTQKTTGSVQNTRQA
jgi:hypothetical protein